VSHHPSETLSEQDADTAVRVFEDFLLHFGESHGAGR